MILNYLSAAEVAKRLGCSPNSISRAAKSAGVGVIAGGRLVAIAPDDVSKVSAFVHATPGNPVWIAGKRPQTARR